MINFKQSYIVIYVIIMMPQKVCPFLSLTQLRSRTLPDGSTHLEELEMGSVRVLLL